MKKGWNSKWRGLGAAGFLSIALLSGCGGKNGQQPGSDLQQGLGMLRTGNYEGALRKLERAVHTAPDNATAQCNLGIVCWKLERPEDALKALRKAALLDSSDPRPLQFLGQLLIRRQRWNEAHDTLKRLNELTPDSPWVLSSLAIIAFQRGENSNTQLLLSKAMSLDPAYPPVLYNMAVFSRDRLKQPEEAANFFRKYIAVAGEDPHATGARAAIEALAKQLMPPPTIPPAEPVTPKPQPPTPEKVRPNPLPTPPLPPDEVPDPTDLVRKPPPSVPAAKPAPKPTPSQMEEQTAAAQLVARAQRAGEKDAIDEALILLQQAVKLDPRSADALWQLAELYRHDLGYPDRAADTYTRFRQTFPDDPRAKKMTVTTPAKESVRKPPARMETAREAWTAGQLCHKEGNLAAAVLYYRRTLELDKRNTDAAYNLGLILKNEGQLGAARDAFQRALHYRSDHAEAGYMLGLVHRELGERDMAIVQIKKTLRSKPDYATARLLLGLLYMDQRDYALARDQFAMALRTAPDAQFQKKARTYLLNAESAATQKQR